MPGLNDNEDIADFLMRMLDLQYRIQKEMVSPQEFERLKEFGKSRGWREEVTDAERK